MSRKSHPRNIKRIKKIEKLTDLKKAMGIENEQELFIELLRYLDKLLSNFNVSYRYMAYRVLGFLEEIALKEDADLIDTCDRLANIREKVVENIKKVNKTERLKNKKIIVLKDIANRLENIEVNILYNLKSSDVWANYNIVEYVLFELKDSNISSHFINNNAYLINAYSINSENIITEIVNHYLSEIDNYISNDKSKDLFYYDLILEKMLKQTKITKDYSELERIINHIHLKKSFKKERENNWKYESWYNHICNKLQNPDFEENLEELNKLHDVSFVFTEEQLGEGYTRGIEKLSNANSNNDDKIITIDDISTYDRDDGLSITKLKNDLYRLKILISDPNFLFLREDLLMEEAKKRVETYYLEDQTIGMFPREIVAEYLSLDENKCVPIREYSYLINSDGEIEDFNITKKISRISKKYTYDEVNYLINNCDNKNDYELIENLLELREILLKHHLDENVLDCTTTFSENLIETYMIFNNNKLAEYFARKNYPFDYRHHADSRLINTKKLNLNELSDDNKQKYLKVLDIAEKANISAFYSMDKKSHESLNLPYYCHSTSPLRRSADILVNECEDMFYFNNPSDRETYKFEKYLKKEIDYINDRAGAIMRYGEKYHKIRKLTMK